MNNTNNKIKHFTLSRSKYEYQKGSCQIRSCGIYFSQYPFFYTKYQLT